MKCPWISGMHLHPAMHKTLAMALALAQPSAKGSANGTANGTASAFAMCRPAVVYVWCVRWLCTWVMSVGYVFWLYMAISLLCPGQGPQTLPCI